MPVSGGCADCRGLAQWAPRPWATARRVRPAAPTEAAPKSASPQPARPPPPTRGWRQPFAPSSPVQDRRRQVQVHVQGGVATIEGRTGVMQHKGVATRLAKSGGAAAVNNHIRSTMRPGKKPRPTSPRDGGARRSSAATRARIPASRAADRVRSRRGGLFAFFLASFTVPRRKKSSRPSRDRLMEKSILAMKVPIVLFFACFSAAWAQTAPAPAAAPQMPDVPDQATSPCSTMA